MKIFINLIFNALADLLKNLKMQERGKSEMTNLCLSR